MIGGAKGNKVSINESKLKKAQKFMDIDDEHTTFANNFESKAECSSNKN